MKTTVSSRSALAHTALFLLAFAPLASALDTSSTGFGQGAADGLDDIWQSKYNAWGLVGSADADNDGCSNLIESIAGTDPFKAGDCLKVGNTIVSGSSVTFHFESEGGKKYRVLSNGALTGTFSTLENLTNINGTTPPANTTEFIPAADSPVGTPHYVRVTKAPGSMRFYKLEVSDADSDNDGLSDWNERQMGTSPTVASSPTNASGGQGTDLQVLNDLLSLTTTVTTGTAYERVDRSATTPLASSAVVTLSRATTRTYPLNVPLAIVNGTTDPTKSNVAPADLTAPATVTIPANATTATVNVTPVQDANEEVPEAAKLQFGLPGLPNAPKPEASVTIAESDPALEQNRRLYVAYLGREAGVTTSGSGISVALLAGDNKSALVSVSYSNLSSPLMETETYIRVGSDLEVKLLPDGQVSDISWNIQAAQTKVTDQAMLTALQSAELFLEIRTMNNPNGEIKGFYGLANGSTTFNPNATYLEPPTYTAPVADALDRDVHRFLTQCTFGPTPELVAEVKAEITSAGGNVINGYSNWLDKQMNPALTPSMDFSTLVMAADNEEFVMRGNRPLHAGNDPQFFNNLSYAVTYDTNGRPTVSTTGNGTYNNNHPFHNNRRREWWTLVLQAKDQVRQRMTMALSEILIISENDQTVQSKHFAAADYWDMLATGAFGKYRTLLEQVTYSPMMGIYLSHIGNRSRYETSTGSGIWIEPDENYAREIMQLFSIGLVLRHPDGSLILGEDGLPLPTYDQPDIYELAKVMTGFSMGARHSAASVQRWGGNSFSTSAPRVSQSIELNGVHYNEFTTDGGDSWWQEPWMRPMRMVGKVGNNATRYHEFGEKTLLHLFDTNNDGTPGPGFTLAAQTVNNADTDASAEAKARADLTAAHNILAGDPAPATYGNGTPASPGHPNTPVNISRWLIQRLVTSNPSAGYIYRVRNAYVSNNGNLGAVLKAILLDPEARSLAIADTSLAFGKVKEPIIHFASMLRGLKAFSGTPVKALRDLGSPFGPTESPYPMQYPQTEIDKLVNFNPPSIPANFPAGPFRYRFGDTQGNFGQSPQRAPSVFNWFLPDFTKASSDLATLGLFAPELQITTETNEVNKTNYNWAFTWANTVGMSTQPGSDNNVGDHVQNSASAAAALRTNTGTLTFTSANWNTAQTITVTANNNSVLSGPLTSLINHSTSSTDSAFDTLSGSVSVSINDNETSGESVILAVSGGTNYVSEGGLTDTLTLRLSSPPSANVDVTITAEAQLQVEGAASATFTFNSSNWSTPQTATFSAINDSANEGNHTAPLTFTTASTDVRFNGLIVAAQTVNIVDSDDGATGFGVLINPSGTIDVTEGTGTDTYTIALAKAPSTGTVTVRVTCNAQMEVNTTGSTYAATRDFTFTTATWSTPQTVTVRAVNDSTVEGNHTGSITHTITANVGGYTTGLAIQPLTTNITDNDNRVIITTSGQDTRVSESGLTDSYTVVLRSAPTGNVTVAPSSSSVSISPPVFNFTTANWNTPQTATVSAIDDMLNEGLHASTITHTSLSTDTNFNAQTVASVPVSVIDNDGARVVLTESAGSTSVTEGSASDTYTLVLSGQPTADVTITLSPSSQVSVSPAGPVTFTSANWSTPVTVTVSAVDDTTVESDHLGLINHTIASTDPDYNGTSLPSITVAIADNESLVTMVSNASSASTTQDVTSIAEGGNTDTVTVVLGLQPASDVVVSLTTNGQFSASPSTLTFTNANWNTAQTVTLTANDDTVTEGAHNGVLSFAVASASPVYAGLSLPAFTFPIVDNDQAHLSIIESRGTTAMIETGTDNYTVVLSRAPTANVTVNVTSGNTATGVTASPTSLTFTTANWNTAQTVTLTAVNDSVFEGRHSATVTHSCTSTDLAYNGLTGVSVTSLIADNEGRRIQVVESDGISVVNENGTTDTFTVVLSDPPNSAVSVAANTSGDAQNLTGTVTFNPWDWNVPRTISFTGVRDTSYEGPEASTVTFSVTSNDAGYNNLYVQPVVFTVLDDDPNLIAVSPDGNSIVTEGGATDTFTVQLIGNPSGSSAVVTLVPNGQITVSPATLTFTTSNGATPQTVTVTAVNDSAIERIHTGTIGYSIANGGGTYNATSVLPISFTVVDNDAKAVSLVTSAGSTDVAEGGATDTYTAVLTAAPTADVTLTINADAQTLVSTSAAPTPAASVTLTFTPANWATPQTVTVTAIEDTTREAFVHFSTLSHALSSTDAGYNGLAVNSLQAAVTDNDNSFVHITQVGGSTVVTESGVQDTYTVVMPSQPSATVTVNIAVSDTQTSVSASTLSFTTTNWATPQTITVTAINDAILEGEHRSVINHWLTSNDLAFNLASIAPVIVTVRDNEPPLLVTNSGYETRVSEAGLTDTIGIALATQPTADVVVTLHPNNQITTTTPTFTFTPANWNVPQNATLGAANDAGGEGPHNGTLNFSLVSDSRLHASTTQPALIVPIIDNDADGITLIRASGSLNVTEGGATDTYTLVCNQLPTANVVVTVTADAQTRVNGAASATLTFTTTDWSTPQTVTVSAVDDTATESRHAGTITHTTASADTGYNAISIGNPSVLITDNDSQLLILGESGNATLLSEAGLTDTYSVSLLSAPTADVTITPAVDSAQVTVTPASLTFTSANWNTLQSFTLRAVDDAAIEGSPHTSTITHAVTTTDPTYTGATLPGVTAFITDNDNVRLLLAHSGTGTTVVENGATDTYTLALSAAPSADVTVNLAANAQLQFNLGSGLVTSGTLTFTTANWSAPQTVTVSAVNDAVIERAHTGIITHTLSSTDTAYHGMSGTSLIATIQDDDAPALVFTAVSAPVTEGGATATYTVRLSSAPTANVTVSVTPQALPLRMPAFARIAGYFASDLPGSNNQRDRIVMDYTSIIELYRTTFYASISAANGGNVPSSPSPTHIQNAHWAATKAIVDSMDLLWCGGSMKAACPVLIEPNLPAPNPLPVRNTRQTLMEGIYNGYSITRFAPSIAIYDPKNPPTDAFHTEIRDRARIAAYLVNLSNFGQVQK